jgi:hypothetical protein
MHGYFLYNYTITIIFEFQVLLAVTVKSAVLIMLPSSEKAQRIGRGGMSPPFSGSKLSLSRASAGFLCFLFLYREDGGGMFLRILGVQRSRLPLVSCLAYSSNRNMELISSSKTSGGAGIA